MKSSLLISFLNELELLSLHSSISIVSTQMVVGCPRVVMVKVMDCGIVVREFELQSLYYVHFRANNLGKGMNPLIVQAMGEIVP